MDHPTFTEQAFSRKRKGYDGHGKRSHQAAPIYRDRSWCLPVIVGIHQPNFMPWLGFFEKIRRSDVFVLLDSVWFSRRSWAHRVRVRGKNGTHWLIVPVHASPTTPLNQVDIVEGTKWKTKQKNMLTDFYVHAPMFKEVFTELWSWISRDWSSLSEMNIFLIERICEWLSISTPLVRSSQLPVTGRKNDLNAAIVRHLGGLTYLCGDGAEGYQDDTHFAEMGIGVLRLRFSHPVYPQVEGSFEPGLSVVDWLFNMGPRSRWWETDPGSQNKENDRWNLSLDWTAR